MTISCGVAKGWILCWYSCCDKLVNLLSFLQAFQHNYFSLSWIGSDFSFDDFNDSFKYPFSYASHIIIPIPNTE